MEQAVARVVGQGETATIVVGMIFAIVATLFIIVGWFMVRTLKQIDQNQAALWKDMKDVRDQVRDLQTEHNLLTRNGTVNVHCGKP